MDYLKLTLSGPLMYFAKTNVTTFGDWSFTEEHPTRRAIIGMIGCAMGIPRGDDRLSALSGALTIKYETIKAGIVMTEFQTAHGWQKGFQRFKGPNDTQNGILKYIEYLMDARFDVYIGGADTTLKEIHMALSDPKYAPYFGKRICVPNEQIVGREPEMLTEADMKKKGGLACI